MIMHDTAQTYTDVTQPDITYDAKAFEGLDYFVLEDLMTAKERRLRDEVRSFVSREVAPIIEGSAQAMKFPKHLMKAFGELGVLGPNLPQQYGCGGHSNITYGLMMQEIERGDSGLRSFCSVQGSLVMFPIWRYGSEAQKQKWLPLLAKADAVGCFALTEPRHGSNPAGLEVRARREGDSYIIDGHKRWATNASLADLCVVWAKDDDGEIGGFLVEMDRKGVSAPPILDKWSLRAAITSEVLFDQVRIPAANRLPDAIGLKAPLTCLTQARFGIVWGVVGAAMSCFDAALQHAKNRHQFDQPIGRYQLIQNRLVDMAQAITNAQLLAWRLGQLKDAGTLRPEQVSLAKRANCRMALEVAHSARQLLGGNGVLGMFPVMRHAMNLEAVSTYEGTDEIHTLIVGRDITGINAFV